MLKRGFTSCYFLFAAALMGCNSLSMAQSTETAPPAPVSGKYCVGPEAGQTAFKLFSALPAEDGSLDFGISIWSESGQNCGVAGKALPTPAGWRYESNLKSAKPEERCALDITSKNGEITVTTDPKASCRASCGANLAFANEVFPAASQKSPSVAKEDLTPDAFFNTACP